MVFRRSREEQLVRLGEPILRCLEGKRNHSFSMIYHCNPVKRGLHSSLRFRR